MSNVPQREQTDTKTPDERLMRACKTVLLAGIHLIENGYGKMGILPYFGGAGYWRCAFHPPGKPNNQFFRYTSGSVTKYLDDHCGGRISGNVSPKGLGKAIMKGVPEWIREQCIGEPTPEMLRWLEMVKFHVDRGYLPQAFHDCTMDFSRWELLRVGETSDCTIPPQPGYLYPGDVPNWTESPFWRPLVEHQQFVECDEDDSYVVPWEYTHGDQVERIATEFAAAIRENVDAPVANLFRAAIAGVDLAFRKKSGAGKTTKEQILKSYALNYGINSGQRILGTCNGYYREFDAWPTKLRLDPDMADTLIEQTFTDEGWAMLTSKMTVTADAEGTLIAEGPEGRHEYSRQFIDDGRPQADEWIWGISFSA